MSEDGKIAVGLGAKVFGPVTNGFVWTKAAGMEAAVDFFKAKGNCAPRYDIKNVIAVTLNGQTIAVVELMRRSPYSWGDIVDTSARECPFDLRWYGRGAVACRPARSGGGRLAAQPGWAGAMPGR